MRFMFKISFPVEAGNAAAKKDGFKTILIVNMEDASEIPAIAEPWFLALNAAIEVTP